MQAGALSNFLESLADLGTGREFSDAGILRLLALHRAHDIQPPVTLLIEAQWRGLTPK